MYTSFFKRCILSYHKNYIIPIIRKELFIIKPYNFLPCNYRNISDNSSNLNKVINSKTTNLTYHKLDTEINDDYDDEYLYPEQFDNLKIPLNKLISYRNCLNTIENINNENKEYSLNTISAKLNKNNLISRNEKIINFLESIFKEKINEKCTVALFGSAINGLWTNGSDLDVCVQIPNVTTKVGYVRNLRSILKVLTPLSINRSVHSRFNAKIPIIHWEKKLPKNKKQFIGPLPRDQAIFDNIFENIPSIDISVNNCLAIINSTLIGSYVSFDPRVRDLILFLKVWAKNRDLNDRSKGTLSSFSISLMLIHFLQNCNPPILPSLQDIAFSTNEPPNYVFGVDCRFTTDINKIKSELNYITKGKINLMDNRTLLTEFFKYYGWYDTHSKNKKITIRSIDLSEFDIEKKERDTEKGPSKDIFLHVDNPFEIGVDVANIKGYQRTRITNELRNGYVHLKSGKTLESLLKP